MSEQTMTIRSTIYGGTQEDDGGRAQALSVMRQECKRKGRVLTGKPRRCVDLDDPAAAIWEGDAVQPETEWVVEP